MQHTSLSQSSCIAQRSVELINLSRELTAKCNDRGDVPIVIPAEASIQFIDPVGVKDIECWADISVGTTGKSSLPGSVNSISPN